jgi:4-aminobutyrate aminotransferase-like enzyme
LRKIAPLSDNLKEGAPTCCDRRKDDHMTKTQDILALNEEGLLAEVLGYETKEVAQEAHGAEIDTYAGHHLIDFTAGIAVHACGHTHPEIAQAISAQAQRVLHVSDTMRHAPQLELAAWMRRLLDRLLPGPSPWTFLFMNSGSESIDAAAKLALKATGRSEFLAFSGAFHGRTLFATALSYSKIAHRSPYMGLLSSLREHIHHLPAPRCQSCLNGQKRPCCCLEALERILEERKEQIAALFFEPVQGEGGYVPLDPRMAQHMQALLRKHHVLLIADEIQTGWGRTGRWFGFEHLGVEPDILVFGKAVGGGLPLAGLAARKALMDKWEPGEHGTTFGGNPVACAAGLAALHILEREGLVERAARLGEAVQQRLRPLIGTYGVSDVRGLGLMIGIEFRNTQGQPDYARCEQIKQRARERGLLLLTCGARIGDPAVDNATLRLIPPLNIPEETLWRGLDTLLEVIRETA